MLLVLDSSIGTSVAVVDLERGVVAERGEADTMRHAEVVGALIRDVLAEAGVSIDELSGVVAGMGPGPFTGLRIGIAAARVFALGAGKPLVPMVSHDAIAAEWYEAGGTGELLVVTDARRRERYYSTYSDADTRVQGPALAKPDDLPEAANRVDATSVSAGALGMVAERRYAAGLPFPADEPLYLRSPDVTLSAGPKRVTA